MTVIKAACPDCGDIDLMPGQVRLIVCADPDWSFYSFTCTKCRHEVRKHADADAIALLRTGGVLPRPIPAEALELHVGPRISEENAIDFVIDLERCEDVIGALEGERA